MNRRDFARTFGAVALAITPGTLRQVNDLTSPLGDRSPEDVATDQDFWFQIRHAFTIDRNQNFLNSGSVSPAPRVVQEAMNQYMTIMNMSPSLWVDELLIPQREHVRRRLAETFGCDPEELAITRNTSEALEAVQLGLRLEAGDEILTTTQDYPRMIECWRQRERRDGVVLRQFAFPVPPPSMDDLYRRFEQAITPRTRVIHFCHITYTTGQIFPVKRICQMARERGIETIVDGAHAFAHFPFDGDALGCDYYGTSLHKWLTAPVGTGFLYIRRDKIRNVWHCSRRRRRWTTISASSSRSARIPWHRATQSRKHSRSTRASDRNAKRRVSATCGTDGCAASPSFQASGCSPQPILHRLVPLER